MASADPGARQRYTTWRELDPVLLKAVEILTERDRLVLAALNRHRVLTTEQIMQLFFHHPTTTQHRLLRLEQYGLLTRFRPWRPTGSAQSHWSLDIPGLLVVEASRRPDDGEEESTDSLLRRMKQRRLWLDQLAHSTHLTHRVETNSFFTRLRWDERTHDDGRRLSQWKTERELVELFRYSGTGVGSPGFRNAEITVLPDGFGAWKQDGREVEFFLEHDRGTEPLSRLQEKVRGYRNLIIAMRRPVVVLFVLPTEGRLRNVLSAVWETAAANEVRLACAAPGFHSANGSTWHMSPTAPAKRLTHFASP